MSLQLAALAALERGQKDSALKYIQVAQGETDPKKDLLNWAKIHSSLAHIHWRSGRPAEQISTLRLILDEIKQIDPKDAGQAAYLLANGQGKVRAARDGTPRAATEWRVLLLSAGELGLADIATQHGGKMHAGQEVRLIDIPADAGAGL